MLPEEQTLLSGLFQRVRTADTTPRDRDAEALIADAVRAQPSAPYYLAQAVIIQEKGLEAAAKHIEDLEAQLRESQEKIHALETQAPRETGGFLGSLFGSAEKPRQEPAFPSSDRGAQSMPQAAQQAAPQAGGPWGSQRSGQPAAQQPMGYPSQQAYPQQGYAQPGYQPGPSGPWDRQQPSAGGGFLRGAMGTAAGVAGGMLLANSLSGIFGNHMSSLGLGGATPAAAPIEETIVNNYYGDDAITQASDTDADPGNQADQADFGNQDGWQQADLDTGGDDGFDGGFGSDDSMDV